jgi:hypothetical protein
VLQRQMSSAAGREQELLERLRSAALEADALQKDHAAALKAVEERMERERGELEARHREELEVRAWMPLRCSADDGR